MNTKVSVKAQALPDLKIPQYRLPMIIFMFLWPALWFSILIYGLGPLLLRADGTISTWAANLIWLLGNGAELLVALVILHREGYKLTWNGLRDRIKLRWPDRWWKWLVILGMFILLYGITVMLQPLEQTIARLLPPPDWLPDHPLKSIEGLGDAYPDVNMTGNFLFIFYRWVILGFICNMVGEELYYRGMLMPKMKSVFEKWDWVANGLGFTLKHLYYYWRLPYIWPGGLGYAFIFGPMGSLPVAILVHWIGNMEPFTLILAIRAALGW